jgi:hypothetical protein
MSEFCNLQNIKNIKKIKTLKMVRMIAIDNGYSLEVDERTTCETLKEFINNLIK